MIRGQSSNLPGPLEVITGCILENNYASLPNYVNWSTAPLLLWSSEDVTRHGNILPHHVNVKSNVLNGKDDVRVCAPRKRKK